MLRKKIFLGLLSILLFTVFLYVSSTITLQDLNKNYLNLLNYHYKRKEINIKFDILTLIINNYKYKSSNIVNNKNYKNNSIVYNPNKPIVYIYNTHSNEEYAYQKNDAYNITPTVLTASYILKDELKKLGIESIVETNNITNIINERKLSYSDSYKISREFLENKILEYPSLIYFIDLHRDSVKRSITTTSINNQTYAKTMFLLGLENPNHQENREVINNLNNYLNENYKGLSRGIYEKQGRGVNGVYNQDFNKNTMLIEVGGVDNTIDEVANSLKIIANTLYNYIENNKTTKLE